MKAQKILVKHSKTRDEIFFNAALIQEYTHI